MVREMLLKPGETFTVEKIVALAVKQNIGLDPSFSSFEKNFGTDDAIGKLRKVGLIPLHRRRENPNKEQSDRYFSMNTFPNQEKLKEILSFFNVIYIIKIN